MFDIVRRWLMIRRAKRKIAELLSPRLPSIKVFSKPGASLTGRSPTSFLIVTETEAEADALLKDYPAQYSQLCEAMVRAGYPADAVPSIFFQIVSPEVIDRDCGGSWHEAMEYPIIRTDKTST